MRGVLLMEDFRIINLTTQGGSFALLTFLVIIAVRWLPKRIEALDKQQSEEREIRRTEAEAHRHVVEVIAKAYVATAEKLSKAITETAEKLTMANAEQQRYERETCEKRHIELMEQVAADHELLREIDHEIKNQAQHAANERALRRKPSQPET